MAGNKTTGWIMETNFLHSLITKGIHKSLRFYGLVLFWTVLLFASAVRGDALQVAMMPSYAQNPGYANAKISTAIEVWGRAWGGTAPYTMTMEYGDNTSESWSTSVAPMTVAKMNNYVGNSHTYASSGSKTAKLTVTDSSIPPQVVSRTAVIRVLTSPTHDQRVNMAIEKGLLWMYKNRISSGTTQYYWSTGYTWPDKYIIASSAFSVLAFEENGHLPGNNYVTDIYADTVQKGLHWLLENSLVQNVTLTSHSDGNGHTWDSTAHPTGICLTDPTDHATYVAGAATLAVIMSQPNATTAQNTYVGGTGLYKDLTYYQLVQKIFDLFSWGQGDGPSYRGGYGYTLNSTGASQYDGSSQQWPALSFIIGKQRWGLAPDQWVIDNAMYGFEYLQGAGGGIGYGSSSSWLNLAKTGGGLCSFVLGNIMADKDTSGPATKARNFVANNWYTDSEGWPGDWYAMYGVKKGLALQEQTTITTPLGTINWYDEMSAWLLGNTSANAPAGHPYIQAASATYWSSRTRDTGYAFGQISDGSWTGGTGYIPTANKYYGTPVAILVLTKAVTKPLPVPIIADVQDQSSRRPASFALDASASYHMDPTAQIVSYKWVWDTSGTIDWNNPMATGPNPTITPNWTQLTDSTHTITLQVTDNASPANTAIATVNVVWANVDVAPIAVAIPVTQVPPIYTGKLGTVIMLDGSNSYDPDPGDTISAYAWDLDGNGTYGDAADQALDITPNRAANLKAKSVTASLQYNSPYSGSVGLQVTANGKTSSNTSTIDVYGSSYDLSLGALSVVSVGTGTATVRAKVHNSPSSSGALSGVIVRFYKTNPLVAGALQIGSDYTVNVPAGGSATVDAALTGLSGLTTIYCFVDGNKAVQEWDEGNNVGSVDVTVLKPVAIAIPASRNPQSYTGLLNSTITLNGTDSFDPGDAQIFYEWDLDGNGTYADANDAALDLDDASAATAYPDIKLTSSSHKIGLRVKANGVTSVASTVYAYAAVDDLDIASISASITTPGVAATLHVGVRNNASSQNTLNNVIVRFYDADPLAGTANKLIADQTINSLAPGNTTTLNVAFTGMNNLQKVYCYVDASDSILEFNENNNVGWANVVNTTPTGLSLSKTDVNEFQASGATVGTLSTTDPDVGDTHTYTLVAGTGSTDNASFTIAGSSLKTAAMLDYETKNSYSIRLRTTDAGGLYYEKAFTITVNDVITTPTLDINTGLSLIRGSSRMIRNTNLKSSDAEVSDMTQIVYTLTAAPVHGSLLKRTVNAGAADTFATVALNGTFTQADIDNGRMVYSHIGDFSAADSFAFTVTADLSTIGPSTFSVSLTSSESITQTTDGQIPNQATVAVSVSGDGRYVAFQSTATNLSVDDSDTVSDIFLLDRVTDQITLVSKSSAGVKGTVDSSAPRISRDGRYIVYYSAASNLVAGDTNVRDDVFRWDRLTGTTIRISVPDSGYVAGGSEGNDDSRFPAVSADGNLVAFHSFAGNLISGDNADQQDVFVRDVNAGTTTRVSVSSAGVEGDNASIYPSMTADGRYVVFQSNARNLVAGDNNNLTDIFMHDRTTHITTRLSLAANGTTEGNGASVYPSITMDGKYVAFQSSASTLIADDSNGATDIYVKNVLTGVIVRASVANDGTQGNGASSEARISDDGHYVVFQSMASNLDAALADTNAKSDIFVRDLRDNRTFRVDLSGAGAQAIGGDSLKPVISDAGRHVVYLSKATNLRTGANGVDQVYVTAFNDVPTITAIANQTINEDSNTGALAFTVNDNMTDPANLAVTVDSSNSALVDQSGVTLGGSASSRTLQLTPKANANGSSTITVTVSDGSLSASRTFALTVNPINDAPVSAGDSYIVAENGTLTINSGSGVLNNDTDVDLNALTAIKLTNPSHGTVTLNANGSFVYTPSPYFNGNDSFTYKANDGQADSAAATVAIQVTAVNYAPVANNDSYNTAEDTLLTVAAPGAMSNDTDSDPEDSLTATKVTNPSHGTLTFNSDGSFTYMPALNYNGPDSFTYKINDGHADSGVATVNITVNAVDDAPVSTADSYTMNEDTTLTVNAPGLISNDSMVDSIDTYSVALVQNVKNGTLTLTTSGANVGKFIYTPKANYYGQDSFTYTLADGHGVSAAATVSITVRNVPDAPVAIEDNYTLAKNGTFTVNAENGILANDYDVDGDVLNAVLYTTPSYGVLTLNEDGSFSYTPNAGFTGLDYFQYAANDNRADSIPVEVYLDVVTPSTAPMSQPNSYVIEQGRTLTVPAPGVLVNDSNPLNQAMTAAKVTDPAHGTVTFNANGSFTYTPNAGFFGSDYFTYKANNGTDGNVADVSITVRMANMSPVVDNPIPTQNGVYGTPLSFQFAANTFSTTVNNNPLTYSAKGVPPGLTFNPATRTFDGTPSSAGSYVTVVEAFDAGTPSFTAAAYFTFNIAKATATVVLADLTHTYDTTAKSATATTAPSGLTVVLTYNGSDTTPSGAGSYAVVGTIDEHNYQGSASGTLVIAKADAMVELSGLSQVYNGTPKSAGATTIPAGMTVEFTYDGSATAPTAAGNYAVVGTINNANYQGSASGTLVVGKAAGTVSLGGLSHTYTGTAKSASATTTPPGMTVTYTYNGNPAQPVGAGSYTVVGTIVDANYEGSATDTMVIDKAVGSVVLGSLSQIYNGSARTATAATVPPGLAVGFTYDGNPTAPVVVGSYAVVATIDDVNYQGSSSGTLDIGKAAAVVTLGGLSQTYSGASRTATATTVPEGLAVTFTYDGGVTAPTGAGSYAVVATISDANYQGSGSGTLVVDKAAAIVALAGLSQAYDGTPKIASATTTPAGKIVTFTYNGSAIEPTDAGNYAVVATINDVNYQGSASGTLVVGKATATVNLAGLSHVYDGTPKSAAAATVPAGKVVTFTYNGSGTMPTAAGSYTVVGTVDDANYQGSATGTMEISKIVGGVNLSGLSHIYDGGPKAAAATTVPAGKTVVITYDGSSTPPTGAGTYTVVASINDVNYQGSTSGSMVIQKAAGSISLSGLAAVYSGLPKSASATTTPPGMAVTYTYNGSATAPTSAGSYAVVGTLNDANYQGSQSGTLVISKAVAPVTLVGLNATYDGTPKIVTATTTPAGRTVMITYGGDTIPPTAIGSYVVVGTVSDDNYLGSASGTLVIGKPVATIVLNGLNASYDGTPKAVTATTTPPGKTVTITYDGSTTVPTAVGNYSIQATVNDASYQGSASGTLVIGKGTAIVTIGSLNATYDGTPKSATATTTPAGKTVVITYDGSATPPISVGSYAVAATISDANYQGSANGTLVIGKAEATVVLSGLSATYDGAAKAATAITTPAGKTVTITYDGSPTVPTAVGSYAVAATISDANYQGSASGTLVIGKAEATVVLSGLSATYDGTAKAATATTTPTGKTVTITYDGSPTAPTAVGSYAVVGTISDANYQGSASGTLVIGKAEVTVVLSSLSATYDGTPKSATATTAPVGKTVTITYDGSSTAPTEVGSYAVVGTITDANYQGSASGTLVIGKATAAITLSGLTAIYDGTPKTAITTTTPSGKTVTLTYAGSATPPTKAGSYTVVGTIDDASYQGSVTETLIIDKAPLTVTAAKKARTYGAANPEFTITYSGFVNNETDAVIDTKPTATTTATAASPVGNYPITPAGGSDDNYTLVMVEGNLAVTKAMLIARADAKARPYGATNPTFTVSYAGFVNDDTESVIDVQPTAASAATAASPAGSYPITLRGGFDNNYKISLVNGVLTVGKAVVTARADNKSRSYGAVNPDLTITYSGFINGDTEAVLDVLPVASTAATVASVAGLYPISLSGGTDNNYTIELVPGVLEISRAKLTATAANKAKAYGSTNPTFTINYTGFVNGDTAASINTVPTAATTATEASSVGNYPITLSGGADDKYSFVLVNGNLAVTKAMLIARANNQTRAFGEANPAFTISYTGFANGDTEAVIDNKPTASTTANAASYAGTYPIALRGGFDNNYKVSLVNGTLTVTATGSVPVAANDTLGTYKNKKTVMSAAKMKANDRDPDGDVLTVVAVSALSVKGGAVALVSGSVSYTPPTDYTGTDSFTYSVTDGHGNVGIGTVSVTVYPPTVLTLIYGPAIESGNVVLRFAGVPGYTYTIEYCASIGGAWQKKVNMTAPASGDWGSGVFQFSEPTGSAGMGYYRAVYPSY